MLPLIFYISSTVIFSPACDIWQNRLMRYDPTDYQFCTGNLIKSAFKQPLICNLFKHYVICVTLKKSLINKVKNWLSGVLSFAGDVWNILLVYSFEESGIMTCLQEGSMNYWMECMTQMSPSRDRYIGVGLYMADQMFCEGLKNLVTGRKCGTRAE